MGGLFFGAAVAAFIMLVLCNAGPFSNFIAELHAPAQVAATVVIALLLVDTKPLLHRTIWHERRDSFVLNEDLNATLRGRSLGVFAGVAVGILIQNFVVV